VSVKPNTSGDTGADLDIDDGRLSVKNMAAVRLIVVAYELLDPSRVESGPAWMRSERWDIEAAPAARERSAAIDPSQSYRQELLKAILRDRFQLAVREETRETPIFALTVDKQLKIKHSDGPALGSFHTTSGRMTARGVEMGQFARRLATLAGRPVMDRTGLTGIYDIDL
jgi:uncharacterized protein (TIGR03435 family)